MQGEVGDRKKKRVNIKAGLSLSKRKGASRKLMRPLTAFNDPGVRPSRGRKISGGWDGGPGLNKKPESHKVPGQKVPPRRLSDKGGLAFGVEIKKRTGTAL